jgi:hypothetical protein
MNPRVLSLPHPTFTSVPADRLCGGPSGAAGHQKWVTLPERAADCAKHRRPSKLHLTEFFKGPWENARFRLVKCHKNVLL